MGMSIVIVASGGLPVTEAANGFGTPVSVASNGFGIPVTIVASGGMPVVGSGVMATPLRVRRHSIPCKNVWTYTRETNAYINLINGLVADGTWTLFDLLYILATKTLRLPRSILLVQIPHLSLRMVSPTFTADVGYTGDGSTGYLDTQWTPSSNGINFTKDSASIGPISKALLLERVGHHGRIHSGIRLPMWFLCSPECFFWDSECCDFPKLRKYQSTGARGSI